MAKIRSNQNLRVKSTQALRKNEVNRGVFPSSGSNIEKLPKHVSDNDLPTFEGTDSEDKRRIAKLISRAGLCSRREAERWILDGRVSVNGRILTSPACVVTKNDLVLVDGSPLPSAPKVQMWSYYKPKGLVTTHSDPQGRPTVFDNLPAELPRVISIGRLDYNTEGLLLLTNSGELARQLELPATGMLRRYRVRARGRVTVDDLKRLREGLEVDGIKYGPIEASVDSSQGANTWLTIGLREGKNREIRKILSFLGLTVSRLIRISYGPFELGNLAQGQVVVIPRRHLVESLESKFAIKLGLIEANKFKKNKNNYKKLDLAKKERRK